MSDLYRIFVEFNNALLLTLVIICLASLSWISWIYGLAKQLNRRLTPFQWGQVYLAGGMCFCCGALFLGYLMYPQNAEALTELIRVKAPLGYLAKKVQAFMLMIIRGLM